MLNLGRADAVRQGAERAMGGGVAVTADDGGARQGETLLRPDDVHDALTDIHHRQILDAKLLGVGFERLDLDAALLVGDAAGAVRRGHVVIGHGQRLFRTAHLAAGHAQTFKGLRARHFVHEMPVNVEQAGPVFTGLDNVVVPDFVIHCAGAGHQLASFSIGSSHGAPAPARTRAVRCLVI